MKTNLTMSRLALCPPIATVAAGAEAESLLAALVRLSARSGMVAVSVLAVAVLAAPVTRADAPLRLVEHEKPIIATSHELLAESATVSPDGQRLAIVSAESQRQRVVVDGRYGRWYDGIARGSMVFSPDSRRLAYVAVQGGKSRVVVDGVDGKPYDTIGGPAGIHFSADGRHWVYSAARHGKWYVVSDGWESAPYDTIGRNSVVLSADGRLAYQARRGKQYVLGMDGREHSGTDILHGRSITFSPDGKRIAYVAQRGARQHVVADGVDQAGYDQIGDGSLVFSPTAASPTPPGVTASG